MAQAHQVLLLLCICLLIDVQCLRPTSKLGSGRGFHHHHQQPVEFREAGRRLLYWRTQPGAPAHEGAAQQKPPKDPPSQTMQLPAPANATRLRPSDQKSDVTVRIKESSSLPPLSPNKFGGYRSEERELWARVYQPDRTLQPLRMLTNRIQLSLQDGELDLDGTFRDPTGTQLGAIKQIAKSAPNVFITVGYPWTKASQKFIQDGFPDGWLEYWKRTYWSVADALASNQYWTGKQYWVELLGEPDLGQPNAPTWGWIYGSDRSKIQAATKVAYDAFKRYPGRIKVGGVGFAAPESQWSRDFLAWCASNGVNFDFISFHHYLGWSDATDPSDYPFSCPSCAFPDYRAPVYNLEARYSQFKATLAELGMGSVPIVLSEFAWFDPDLDQSAGFGDPSRSARTTISHHHSCARTLQALELVQREPTIVRAYWAQGAGSVGEPWWTYAWSPRKNHLFSYDPFVVFDQEAPEPTWRYKSSYYAFWMLGQLSLGGSGHVRVDASAADPALGVWAAKDATYLRIAIWNRGAAPRQVALELPGVPRTWRCTLYRVDESTFTFTPRANAPAPVGELDWVVSGPTTGIPPVQAGVATVRDLQEFLDESALGGEATLFVVIKTL